MNGQVVRRAKLEAERKKKETEDQLLSDEPVDTQQAAGKIGNLTDFLINLFFPLTHRKPRIGNKSRHILTSNYYLILHLFRSFPKAAKEVIPTITMHVFFILLLFAPSHSSDQAYHGRKVIMQSDVDTILIHTKLGPIYEHLQSSETELRTIQNSIIQIARNEIMAGDYDSKFLKVLVGIVRGNMETISTLKSRLSKVTQPASSVKSKRALEILGDFLSGITGVPSASDHRKTLE